MKNYNVVPDSNCDDDCGEEPCNKSKLLFKKNVPDCAKFTKVKAQMSIDDVIVKLLENACVNKDQYDDLRDSINTIQKNSKQCCPLIRQLTSCCEPNKVKLTKYRRALNGLSPTILDQEGDFITDLTIAALKDDGVYVVKVDNCMIITWLDFEDSTFDIAINCEATVSTKTIQSFNPDVCSTGQTQKVALFKKDGVTQSGEGGVYNAAFEAQLIGLGFQKVGTGWIIFSEYNWDLEISCVSVGSNTYSFPIVCTSGCTYNLPIAGLTKNGVSLNSTAQDFATQAQLLSYLQGFDPAWMLSGNYFVITSLNVWGLTVVCTNCGGGSGTSCVVTATYNGSSSGASIYIYYKVNGGAVQNTQLSNGGTLSVPTGSSLQIVGLQPVGSNQSEWVITDAGCPNLIENDPMVTVSSLTAYPGGSDCTGSILLTASVSGLDNYAGNTIVIKVDNIVQTVGTHYTKTYNTFTGNFDITTEVDVTMLAFQSLCQDAGMCACGNGYFEDSTHEVKIIATNAAGNQFIYSSLVTF